MVHEDDNLSRRWDRWRPDRLRETFKRLTKRNEATLFLHQPSPTKKESHLDEVPVRGSVTRIASLLNEPNRRISQLSSNSDGGDIHPSKGITSQQSEQLHYFKDYYSQDYIHPRDKVSVLWAYEPRAPDEFALERGDMLKVVGLWDDGWATGIMLDERAENWEAKRQGPGGDSSPIPSGEIKAIPLVCVCLPEHWKTTIEGDGAMG